MFWADAVERSRTERLGRSRANKIRQSIREDLENTPSHTAASKQAAEAFMTPLDRNAPSLESLTDGSTPPEDALLPSSNASLACANFVFSVGQQVDAAVNIYDSPKLYNSPPPSPTQTMATPDPGSTIQWRNATVLDVHPTQGARVGFRLYHDSGPFTEHRSLNGKHAKGHGKMAFAFATRAFASTGEYPPLRYFGKSQDYDCWVPLDRVVGLATQATNLLNNMDATFKDNILGSLSRLELRRSREQSGDVQGALAMDRAMVAYQSKEHGSLHYYSMPSSSGRYDKWKAKLRPATPITPIHPPPRHPPQTPQTTPVTRPGPPPNNEDGTRLDTNSAIVERPAATANDPHVSLEHPSLMEIQFVPSLTFTGNVPGYSYELQARGLGYYTKPHVLDEGEKGQQELRTLQIRTLTRELEVCQQLKQPEPQDDDDEGRGAEEVDDSSRMAAVNERECDIRLQLAMLMRLDVNAMWKVEQQLHPPLEDELQSGPSAPSSIATIQQALALLRGILLIDSNHARYFARPRLATTVHYYHCTTTTALLPRCTTCPLLTTTTNHLPLLHNYHY